MSRRITRSQTMCLPKAPVFTFVVNGKRKSAPQKKLGDYSTPATNAATKGSASIKCVEQLDSQQIALTENASLQKTPNRTSNRAIEVEQKSQHEKPSLALKKCSVNLNSDYQLVAESDSKRPSKKTSDVEPKSPLEKLGSVCKKSSTPAPAKVNKSSKGETIPDGGAKENDLEGKAESIPTAETIDAVERPLHDSSDVPTKDFETEPIGNTASTLISALDLEENKSIRVPRPPLRRSTRITSKPAPPTTVAIPATNEAQPLKIKQRRSTSKPAAPTTADVVASSNAQPLKIKQRRSTLKPAPPTTVDIPVTSDAPTLKIKQRRSTVTTPSRQTNNNNNNNSTDGNAQKFKRPASRSKRDEMADSNTIAIPNELKEILLDDSYFINNQKNLYEIPLAFNVAEVIAKYIAINEDNSHSSPISIKSVFDGIIEYFDALIGRQLLYEPERVQYEVLLQNYPGTATCKIYPPIYLLRLLVHLNKLLPYGSSDNESLKRERILHLNKFVKYLAENKTTFFNINISR